MLIVYNKNDKISSYSKGDGLMKKKTVSDSDIEKYLKIQKHKLSNIYSQEEVSCILSFMRNDIYGYIQNHPGCQINDIDAHLTISDIYSDWIANSDVTDIIEKIDHQSISKSGGRFIVVIVLLIILSYITYTGIERYIFVTSWNTMQQVDKNAPEVNR